MWELHLYLGRDIWKKEIFKVESVLVIRGVKNVATKFPLVIRHR